MNASGGPINNILCIKDLDQYFLDGSFESEVYSNFKIQILLCANKTDASAVVCKYDEVIRQKMKGYFGLYTMDYLIDPNNFKNPGQPIGSGYYTRVSIGMSKYTTRFIASTTVHSNDEFLFDSFNHYVYPTYKEDKETIQTDDTNSGLIMTFVFRKYHNDLKYERKHKKLQNILAEMGGFIQLLYLVFTGLTSSFVSKKYYDKIINAVFNFELNNPSKNVKIKVMMKSRNMESVNSKNLSSLNALSFVNKNEKKTFPKLKDNFSKYMNWINNKSPLKMTNCEFLKNCFFPFKDETKTPLTKKLKRLKTGKHSIKQKLDISY